jgi:hypothetical protein
VKKKLKRCSGQIINHSLPHNLLFLLLLGASPAGNPEEASANSNPPPEVVTEAWLIQNVAVSGIEDYLLFFWRTNRIGILFVAKLGDCLPT